MIVHRQHASLDGARFVTEDRSVVAVLVEGQEFTLRDADLLVALGSPSAWANAAQYIQAGLTHATGLSGHRIIQIAAEEAGDVVPHPNCSLAQVPMKARSQDWGVREAAAIAISRGGASADDVALLAADPHEGVRSMLAGWRDLPVDVAMTLANDSDPSVLRTLVGCNGHPSVCEVASRNLFLATNPNTHAAPLWSAP